MDKKTSETVRFLVEQLSEAQAQIEFLEGNQRNAESGTTGGSAAGNPDDAKAELLSFMERELIAWKRCDQPDTHWGIVALDQIIDEYEIMLRILKGGAA